MAARRGRRDGVAPSPTGGPGPDPGGGVRGSGWGSRNQAPHGTVGTVSCGEQVRGWRAAGAWQQSGVCRAVTRGRHRKGRKRLGVDAGLPPESDQAGPREPKRFAGGPLAEVEYVCPFLGTPEWQSRVSETGPAVGEIRDSELKLNVKTFL